MMTKVDIYAYLTGIGVVCPEHYHPEQHGRPGEPGVRPLYERPDAVCAVGGERL
jgi:hypothetical protein